MSHLSEEKLAELATHERNRAEAPLTNWESLSTQLRAEGIIRDSVRPWMSNAAWLRAAAAVLLVAGGAVLGRYSFQRELKPTASTAPAAAAATFKSPDEAWAVLNKAGEQYQRASAYLASRDVNQGSDSDKTAVYQARLTALDGMTSASRQALYEAPHDPVINQYYMAAMGAREATLRQLKTSLPSGTTLERF
jgi:hypothetical protein